MLVLHGPMRVVTDAVVTIMLLLFADDCKMSCMVASEMKLREMLSIMCRKLKLHQMSVILTGN